MKIVFFGTSDFALGALRGLVDSRHNILAVVTQPDRQKGRRLKVMPPPTKVLAETRRIAVYQPADASSRDSAAYLKGLGADIFVVVAFGQILKKEILDIPRVYSINIHGSLLPRYRGAAPTNWAIINGDTKSGVTIIKMNEAMDEGDIILKKETGIDPDDTNITLTEKLSDLGAAALMEAIGLIESGSAMLTPQDGGLSTYAPKLKKADGLIDWKEDAETIARKVRGLLPWPSAYTHYDKKMLKILQAESIRGPDTGSRPGQVIDILKHKGVLVQTGDGGLLITFVQIEAKRPFDTDAFLCGHKLGPGYIFS
jgi:methionyl-tRNA formyltransferase